MRAFLLLLLTCAACLAAGCSNYVQKADYRPGRELPYDASPAPVLFRKVELILPVGMDVGFESSNARACGWPRYPVSRTALRGAIDHEFIEQTFHDALEAQGYDIVGGLDIAYDLDDELDRAEYSVTAKIRDVQLEICHNEPDNIFIFFTTRRGVDGEFYMNVDWTVYDPLRRAVVYKTKTEGYTKRRVPNQEGMTLMFSEAFEMAAHNLGADKGFYDLVVTGRRPEGWREERFDGQRDDSRPGKYDPLEPVIINNPPLSNKAFTQDIDDKRKVAVMVQKFGHGSGFFISGEGHILTNAHAVGDGLRTRIVTFDKGHKLVAEILRVDKARDVALLKLEEIPAGLKIKTLPIRAQWPGVGEDAYAIGVPKDYRTMQDTVTKGIISAHRREMKFLGTRQNFIQADVEVQQGSSGGPLLDANGNITGIAVGALTDANAMAIGLNYFIPIGEALKALEIDIIDDNGAPVPLLP